MLALVAEHCPHAPPGWHAGVAPPHSPSPAHARHVCVATLHTGVAPLQSLSARHVTHVPAVVKQTGVAPAQRDTLPAEHWPHAPLAWHAGVVPPHSPSPPQARQRCVPPSHTGVDPPQSALATQRTHVPVGAKQTGVAPPQASEFDVEHWPHAPLG